MPLLTVILVLIVVGVLVAVVNKYGPEYIDVKFIRFINIVAVIATIIWLAKVFGVWDYLMTIKT